MRRLFVLRKCVENQWSVDELVKTLVRHSTHHLQPRRIQWVRPHRRVASLCALSLALAGCPPEPQYPKGDRDELKVTRVVLYQNGIGYFERRGRVDGDVVRLRIRPSRSPTS